MDRMKKCALALLAALLLAGNRGFAMVAGFDGGMTAKIAESVVTLSAYGESGKLLHTGTGFVAFDGKTLVTNSRVTDGAVRVTAVDRAGREYQVTQIVGSVLFQDAVILEFEEMTGLAPLPLETDATPSVHETVAVVGSPEAEQGSVVMGSVAAIREERGIHVICFTASIPLTGGVLINEAGQVAGLVYGNETQSGGLNLAVDAGAIASLYREWDGKPRTLIKDYTAWVAGVYKNLAPAPTPLAIPALAPPEYVLAIADGEGIHLSWDAVENANRYYIYRCETYDGVYLQTGVSTKLDYLDDAARAGQTYYYKVRSVNGYAMSLDSPPARAAVPDPYAEPIVPLIIGDSGYLGAYMGCQAVDIKMTNTSRTRTVDGFRLSIYCKDAQGNAIADKDGGTRYLTVSLDMAIGPDSSAYIGPVVLEGFDNVKTIHAAVAWVHTADGADIPVNKKDMTYYYWTVK